MIKDDEKGSERPYQVNDIPHPPRRMWQCSDEYTEAIRRPNLVYHYLSRNVRILRHVCNDTVSAIRGLTHANVDRSHGVASKQGFDKGEDGMRFMASLVLSTEGVYTREFMAGYGMNASMAVLLTKLARADGSVMSCVKEMREKVMSNIQVLHNIVLRTEYADSAPPPVWVTWYPILLGRLLLA